MIHSLINLKNYSSSADIRKYQRHIERDVERFLNRNIDKDKSNENVVLYSVGQDFNKVVNDVVNEFDVALQKKTTTICSFLLTLNPDNDNEINFSKEDYVNFFKIQVEELEKKYNFKKLSCIIHFDEIKPHCHLSFIPLVKNENFKDNDKDVLKNVEKNAFKVVSRKLKKEFPNFKNDIFTVSKYKSYKMGKLKRDVSFKELDLKFEEYFEKEIQNQLLKGNGKKKSNGYSISKSKMGFGSKEDMLLLQDFYFEKSKEAFKKLGKDFNLLVKKKYIDGDKKYIKNIEDFKRVNVENLEKENINLLKENEYLKSMIPFSNDFEIKNVLLDFEKFNLELTDYLKEKYKPLESINNDIKNANTFFETYKKNANEKIDYYENQFKNNELKLENFKKNIDNELVNYKNEKVKNVNDVLEKYKVDLKNKIDLEFKNSKLSRMEEIDKELENYKMEKLKKVDNDLKSYEENKKNEIDLFYKKEKENLEDFELDYFYFGYYFKRDYLNKIKDLFYDYDLEFDFKIMNEFLKNELEENDFEFVFKNLKDTVEKYGYAHYQEFYVLKLKNTKFEVKNEKEIDFEKVVKKIEKIMDY